MNIPTPLPKLHEAARRYVSEGRRVIPIEPNGKRPLIAKWQAEAFETVEEVDAHWSEHPESNIALIPEDMGWCVVEQDPGGTVEGLNLPATYEVESPRGGTHYYFEGSLPPSASKLAPHVDTRGRTSYVLVPPSVVNGKRYRVKANRPMAPLPSEIAARLETKAEAQASSVDALDLAGNVSKARSRVADLIARKDIATEGRGGDNRTYQLACELVRDFGLTVDTALEVIAPWNAACAPPWGPEELRAKLEHAAEYGQNEPGAYGSKPAAEVFKRLPSASALPQRPAQKFLMTPAELLSLPTPEPLVADFLMQHENAAMYGAEKLGKSFAALDVALSITANVPVFGTLKVCRTGPVIYCTGEGQFGFKARLLAWGQAHGIDVNTLPFYFKAEVPRAMDGLEQTYIDGIRSQIEREPVLVIFDTLANSIVGEDENGSKALSRYWSMVQTIGMNLGAATLTLAHTGKDEAKGIRGWSGTGGTIDRSIEVEGDRDAKTLKLHHRYAKDTPDFADIQLRLKPVMGSDFSSAVIEPISREQFEATSAPRVDAERATRTVLADKLLELKIFARARGRLIDDMAEVLAGPQPRGDDAEEQIKWQTRRSTWREKLRKGTRPHSNGKGRPPTPPQLHGLFTLEDLTNCGETQPVFWMPEPDTANEELEE